MPGKLSKIINFLSHSGWRYVSFRVRYELLRKSGLYKKKFPAAPPFMQYVTLNEWKAQPAHFFFKDKASVDFPRNPQPELKEKYDTIKEGKLLFFNSVVIDLGKNYDWITNPDSGFHYDINKHWTEISDHSKTEGDIKFVWEKSRFSYLYYIIRYDYHFNEDCAEFVFKDILSWIKSNPVNCGPNYRCSQEMSLRVMNWTFALYYYRNSPFLTDEVFDQMQYSIYWHMDHVYKNIDFSRIAVRNNHAITETLALYLTGLFFPSLPGAAIWKKNGKAWFEEEIAYQVYEDGTFLQFSMNYHRVVVQLLTWGITLSEKNAERFSDVVYDRAKKSLMFLRTCMIDESGWLPNYGANDGTLFFKLNMGQYRDYRGQLQALANALNVDLGLDGFAEDTAWYGLSKKSVNKWQPAMGAHSFDKGGYYVIREPETLTFMKCGSYKDRPSQADNLHLDIWYKGENILPDGGSYKYNTDAATVKYFTGTQSHNTVMLGVNDQMLKGRNFIWFYWSRCTESLLKDEGNTFKFTGSINAFKYIKDDIVHRRTVTKQKGTPVWEIKDEIIGAPDGTELVQLWHVPLHMMNVIIRTKNKQGGEQEPQKRDGWYSSVYGQREKTEELYFSTGDSIIYTTVKLEPAR